MTVGYMRVAATAGPLTFVRLLCLWRGSVWKAIHPELFTWLFFYIIISCMYRFALRDSPYGEAFARLVTNMDAYLTTMSSALNFVLGFFVSYVAQR